MQLHAIIPAGGAGTRLWPISRADSPKFLKDLTGSGSSLLQQTVHRLKAVAGENIVVVTGTHHIPAVARQLPQLPAEQFIAEPSARDSMAAIGLAVAIIRQRHGNVIIGSFAADHVITQPQAFADAIETAAKAAEAGYVVTIGITPDYPATGFGYIRATQELAGIPGGYAVGEFLEKPAAEVAQQYCDSGQYVWNAGMFIAQADVLLGAVKRYQPDMYATLLEIAQAWDTPEGDEVLAAKWSTLPKIAIDHAVAEPLADDGGVAVVPASMGWTDVGDFAAVSELLREKGNGEDCGNVVVADPHDSNDIPVVAVNSSDCTVFTAQRPVALIGMSNVIVVDTPDALLVAEASQAQEVKQVVEQLRDQGWQSILR